MTTNAKIRYRAARLALVATIVLTVGKIAVGLITKSVGVLSEGIHSSLDLVSAAIAFFTIRAAGKPADHDHPYGHGKIETLSSLLEGVLLVVAAGFILFEGIDHLKNPEPITQPGLAILTILISLIVSVFVYFQNKNAARITDSSAIQVNALHFLADAVTSLGVLGALFLIWATGWLWVDPVIAIIVAIYIFTISFEQLKKTVSELVDTRLPEEEVKKIEDVIQSFEGEMIEAHDLRTRKSGADRLAEFHLIQCGKMSVEESHELCDRIEAGVHKVYPAARVTIHVESCSHAGLSEPVRCPKSRDGKCVAFK